MAALLLLGGFAARLGIFLAHGEFFAGIGWFDFLFSVVRGLRYDLATAALVLLPALGLILLPGQAWWWRWSRYLGYIWLSLSLAFTVLFGVASTQFFAFFYRHLGVEVKTVFSDFDFILQMAVEQNLWAVVLVLIGLALTVRLAAKMLPRLSAPEYGVAGYGLRLAAVFIAGELLLWGSLGRQFVDSRHAFADDDLRLGQLVLNPAFAGFNNLFFPQSVEAALASLPPKPESSPATVGGQALLAPAATQPNVLMVILESWTPAFIGAFGAKESITPNFDQIAALGRRYQQMYANGPISIYGLQALLTGMPHLPGMPLMGFSGVEQLPLPGIATVAQEAGYQTLWAQAPRRASFNMDWLAKRWGYQQVAGREDYHTPPEWEKTPFGWDWPLYEYALATLSQMQAPFFATLYTAVTHVPYVEVPTEQQLRPHDPAGVDGYINTLHRADWALGKFWQQAQQQPWHENTVYIFVADHVIPKDMPDKSPRGRYRIPLLIVGPGIGVADDQQLASQIDILPTLQALTGAKQGKLQARQGVLTSDGATSYWLTANSSLGRYPGKPIFAERGVADPQQAQQFSAAECSFYQQYLQAR